MLLFVIPYIIIIYSLRKEVDIMNYISVKAASEKWGISERRIQKLCEENRIDGTEKFGRAWMIPKDAEKPVDGRMKTLRWALEARPLFSSRWVRVLGKRQRAQTLEVLQVEFLALALLSWLRDWAMIRATRKDAHSAHKSLHAHFADR